jgi:hypothetical protein
VSHMSRPYGHIDGPRRVATVSRPARVGPLAKERATTIRKTSFGAKDW